MDLTAQALRRVAANLVDRLDDDGAYRRALIVAGSAHAVEVRQRAKTQLRVRVAGPRPREAIETVRIVLGTDVQLRQWRSRAQAFPWLGRLARFLEGLHPPRYPELWEAFAHAIVFQQISIQAGAAIMGRVVQALAAPVTVEGQPWQTFFTPAQLLGASDSALQSAGLSRNKIAHLRAAATAVQSGLTAEHLSRLSTADAAEALCTVRGIGPWSAAVVLLRGLGRLDVFPLKDSGVARSLALLSGDANLNADALLAALGPVRGMLYFHLLLGRLRNLTAANSDWEIV